MPAVDPLTSARLPLSPRSMVHPLPVCLVGSRVENIEPAAQSSIRETAAVASGGGAATAGAVPCDLRLLRRRLGLESLPGFQVPDADPELRSPRKDSSRL